MHPIVPNRFLSDWGNFEWQTIQPKDSPLPPRQLHTTVEYNDRIFVFGGYETNTEPTNNQPSELSDQNNFFYFDFSTQTWSYIKPDENPTCPPLRHSHSAVVYNNQMWVFGGMAFNTPNAKAKKLNDLWCWDFKQNSWQLILSKKNPLSRAGHSAVVFNDSMYIFGGRTKTNQISVFSFSKRQWTHIDTKGDPPLACKYHSAIVYESNMFILGGGWHHSNFDIANFGLYQYQFETSKWRKLWSPSKISVGVQEWKYTATLVGDYWMIIPGGSKSFTFSGNLDYRGLYSLQMMRWEQRESPPNPSRSFHSIFTWRDSIVIFGGVLASTQCTSNDISLLGPDSFETIHQTVVFSSTNSDSLQTLPRDLKLRLAQLLTHIDLISLGTANKEWYRFSLTESLWEFYFIHEYVDKMKQEISPGHTQSPNEQANNYYKKNKQIYLEWKLEKHHEGVTFWKTICAEHFPRKRGITWIPPCYPDIRQIPQFSEQPAPLRVIVLGEGGVGKSSIVIQYSLQRFVYDHDPTIEDCFRKKVYIKDCGPVLLEIIDTALEEEFAPMSDRFLRDAEGYVFCYSIASRRSFDQVSYFVERVTRAKAAESFSDAKIPAILIGNKCDLWDMREVTSREGNDFAKAYNIPFFETSAWIITNIDELFYSVAELILHCRFSSGRLKNQDKNAQDSKDKCSMQ